MSAAKTSGYEDRNQTKTFTQDQQHRDRCFWETGLDELGKLKTALMRSKIQKISWVPDQTV